MRRQQPLAARAGLGPAGGVHRLSEREFDALASGEDQESAISVLVLAERSRRRLQLRAVLDVVRAADHHTGPLADVDDAWDLLVTAEQECPDAIRTLLDHPPLGAWAAWVLRRIHGYVHDDVPIWADVGYLHAVAVAAAIRAAVRFELAVPLRHGCVHLPTVGSATNVRHRDPWETVTVSSGDVAVRLVGSRDRFEIHECGSSDGRWRPAAGLRSNHVGGGRGHPRLAVLLEDADPYRGVARPARPARLSSASRDRWQLKVDDAWAVLVETRPDMAAAMSRAMRMIVPAPAAERFRPRGASSGDAFGSAWLSEPENGLWLAEMLIHEFQHAKLGAIMHLVELFDRPGDDLFYAPWRSDPRPLAGLLHGIFAFSGVTAFWRCRRGGPDGPQAALADFEFALGRHQVREALDQILDRPELTAFGRRFLNGVALRIEGWLHEPVSSRSRRLALLASGAHRAGWMIRYRRPDPEEVETLVHSWWRTRSQGLWQAREVRGRVPAVAPTAPGSAATWPVGGDGRGDSERGGTALDARTALIRLWLTDRATFREMERSGEPGRQVSGASPADVALVRGDTSAAAQGYRATLKVRPDDADAWSGIIVSSADCDTPSWRALLDRAHLLHTVSAAIAAAGMERPDPLALVSWIGWLPDMLFARTETATRPGVK